MAKELTLRQKKAVSNLVENGGNKYKALKDANYSDAIATNPGKVFQSKTVMEACRKAGLTRDFIAEAIHKDIADKANVDPEKRNRTQELKLAAQLTQMTEPDTEKQVLNFSQITINVKARD